MDNIIGGSNWYCEETNQWHRIASTTLPVLDREMSQYLVGSFALELPDEVRAMSAQMTVNGEHDDLRIRFGRDAGDWTNLRYYEKLLDVFPTGDGTTSGPTVKGRTVFLKGLLNTYTPGGANSKKANGATQLRWSSIVLYHDLVDGRTVHKFDLQNNTLIIDGVNYTAEHNRILAI